MELINTTNTIFSIGTIVSQVLFVLVLIGILSKDKGKLFAWFSNNVLILITLISFGAVFGSLFYQYVIGFEPCMLCWYQRIAMYPIFVISLIALIKKEYKNSKIYITSLTIIGFIISILHLTEKYIGKELVSCGATQPSCLQNLVSGFGYIDIPLMSFSFFLLIIILLLNTKRFR